MDKGVITHMKENTHQTNKTGIYNLDINFCINAKCGQKVLFRERVKSAYFQSAS